MQQPLISIIVPVYNAEPFLEHCLSSIRKQTYQTIEVILVDDGSTDRSNEICRKFVKEDNRFKLFTQANGGRSAARNTGLAQVQGMLVGFVDSDDWVDEDMFEVLYNTHLEENADIVQCSYYYHNGDRVEDMSLKEKKHILNTKEALELLFRDKEIKNFLCNKLFLHSLFQGIIFPLNKNFEDQAVMYRIFEKARRVVCLPIAKYHYLVSPTSISHASFSVKEKFDYLEALNGQYHFACSVGLWKKSSVVLAKKYLSILDEFLKNDADPDSVGRLTGFLRDNINGWELLRYAPYRAFRRFMFLHFRGMYNSVTRQLKK